MFILNLKKKDETKNSKIPKLVELFQFSTYEDKKVFFLPHQVDLDDILFKVLESITNLCKQPHYRSFLRYHFYSVLSKRIIHVSRLESKSFFYKLNSEIFVCFAVNNRVRSGGVFWKNMKKFRMYNAIFSRSSLTTM
jgi:hypothetical protein